jgi:hypothetical protein
MTSTLFNVLRHVTTGTITTVLLKKGNEGAEHEFMEGWIVSEVEKGVRLPGLYPMNDEARARYEAWKKQR